MKYATERLSTVKAEIAPLLDAHWREIAHFQDIQLEPDWDFYAAAEDIGRLRIFTARDGDKLIGYSVFFVGSHPHYKSSIQAAQDVIFIHPDYRGARVGAGLILYGDAQCKAENIQVIFQHIKAAHDFGPLLVHCGYELMDLIYTKRLDK